MEDFPAGKTKNDLFLVITAEKKIKVLKKIIKQIHYPLCRNGFDNGYSHVHWLDFFSHNIYIFLLCNNLVGIPVLKFGLKLAAGLTLMSSG